MVVWHNPFNAMKIEALLSVALRSNSKLMCERGLSWICAHSPFFLPFRLQSRPLNLKENYKGFDGGIVRSQVCLFLRKCQDLHIKSVTYITGWIVISYFDIICTFLCNFLLLPAWIIQENDTNPNCWGLIRAKVEKDPLALLFVLWKCR